LQHLDRFVGAFQPLVKNLCTAIERHRALFRVLARGRLLAMHLGEVFPPLGGRIELAESLQTVKIGGSELERSFQGLDRFLWGIEPPGEHFRKRG
jgi:hypothetical protein